MINIIKRKKCVKMHTQIINMDSPDNKQLLKTAVDIEVMVQGTQAWGQATMTKFLAMPYYYLMLTLIEDEVVAYCLYYALFESAEILRIGTHLNWQKQGIASQLLHHLIIHLQQQQVENLLLEVRADNTPAINLYKKLGFQQIDCRKGYYANRNGTVTNAIIMSLRLTS